MLCQFADELFVIHAFSITFIFFCIIICRLNCWFLAKSIKIVVIEFIYVYGILVFGY